MPIQVGKRDRARAEFDAGRVALALASIEQDRTTIDTANLADTKKIIKRILNRQEAIIKLLEQLSGNS